MNPKDDNQTPQKKYFDVAPPGKAPASSNSRQYYSDKPPVKDFDFADKPSDSDSKFKDLQNEMAKTDNNQKPGAPDLGSQPENPDKNRLDLDKSETGSDLSEIESELSNSSEGQHDTDFRPDDFETADSEIDQPETPEEPYENEKTEENPKKQTTENVQKKTNSSSSSKQKTESSKPSESNPRKERIANSDTASQNPQPMSNTPLGEMVVSQHSGRGVGRLLAELLAVLVILLLIAGIVNLLLDAGLVTLDGIPHTDFFSE